MKLIIIAIVIILSLPTHNPCTRLEKDLQCAYFNVEKRRVEFYENGKKSYNNLTINQFIGRLQFHSDGVLSQGEIMAWGIN
jgi:hypothetical protein